MMVESMDAARIIGYFKGKSILITGSTGFLGKSMLSQSLSLKVVARWLIYKKHTLLYDLSAIIALFPSLKKESSACMQFLWRRYFECSLMSTRSTSWCGASTSPPQSAESNKR
jgi:hypothetical protein